MHDSLTIALLQAREAAMAHFRPIVKRHNLTEQQWRIVRILAEKPIDGFPRPGPARLHFAPQPDRDSDPHGARRFSVAFKNRSTISASSTCR